MTIPGIRKGNLLQGLIDLCEYIGEEAQEMGLLELGSWLGSSTTIFAGVFRHVVAVEPFCQEYIDRFFPKAEWTAIDVVNNFHTNIADHENITLCPSYEKIFYDTTIANHDVIYVDMNHDYEETLEVLKRWAPRCKRYLCGHDYTKRFPGVIKAVNELYGKPDATFKDGSFLIDLKKRRQQ